MSVDLTTKNWIRERLAMGVPISIRSDGKRSEIIDDEVSLGLVAKRRKGESLFALKLSANRTAERTGAKAEPIRTCAILTERQLREMRDFIDRELAALEAE